MTVNGKYVIQQAKAFIMNKKIYGIYEWFLILKIPQKHQKHCQV